MLPIVYLSIGNIIKDLLSVWIFYKIGNNYKTLSILFLFKLHPCIVLRNYIHLILCTFFLRGIWPGKNLETLKQTCSFDILHFVITRHERVKVKQHWLFLAVFVWTFNGIFNLLISGTSKRHQDVFQVWFELHLGVLQVLIK